MSKRIAITLALAVLVACPKDHAAAPDASSKKTPPGAQQNQPTPAPPDVAAVPPDAEKSASGIAWKVLEAPTSTEKAEELDKVSIIVAGWTTDGKSIVDSRGRPAVWQVRRSPGFTEVLTSMSVGEKRRIWMPESLAPPPTRKDTAPGLRVFDVKLLSIHKGPKPIPPPADVAAAPADATKTPSGIAYKILKPGTGKERPTATSFVQFHYTGWTTDGKMFDSSTMRQRPTAQSVELAIPGWKEMFLQMAKGEQRRVWIPEELGYKGQPGMPSGMLVFEIELLDFVDIVTPPDVAAPPKNAKKTASGLAYVVLRPGTGKVKPQAGERVRVHYAGWTTDGKMFDSSYRRFQPAEFGVNDVIKGWTEGLQLMVVGDKLRMWIPEELAYKGVKGRPQGMLVFDVELIEIGPAQPAPMMPGPGGMPGGMRMPPPGMPGGSAAPVAPPPPAPKPPTK